MRQRTRLFLLRDVLQGVGTVDVDEAVADQNPAGHVKMLAIATLLRRWQTAMHRSESYAAHSLNRASSALISHHRALLGIIQLLVLLLHVYEDTPSRLCNSASFGMKLPVFRLIADGVYLAVGDFVPNLVLARVQPPKLVDAGLVNPVDLQDVSS
jgi:hypothetical protein